ncbi:hypothetical protein NOR_07266 [Metarhizium rileyi]|uniref:Uncharacterized protein n=1 Tax=Metarhizium rileyi (strain RCEF 4871) TaxID=1649241 RepID=A0A166YTV9_METRR|nr:hypothetical protein NOR_07266 [Metarhizium rileyi RCEF 4871]
MDNAEPVHEMSQEEFEKGSPTAGDAWIKWNVKGGRDRTETRTIGVDHSLNGNPHIQAVTIRSAPVTLHLILAKWSSIQVYPRAYEWRAQD